MNEKIEHKYTTEKGEEITIIVKELRLRQYQQMIPILAGSDIDVTDSDELIKNPKKLLNIFMDEQRSSDLMRIMFACDYTNEQLGDMPDHVLWDVVLDFLACNGGLKKLWNGLLNVISSLIMGFQNQGGLPNPPSNDSSSGSAKETRQKKKSSAN